MNLQMSAFGTLNPEPEAVRLPVTRAQPVECAHPIIFGEVHFPDKFEMIVGAVVIKHRCKWLGSVDCAHGHPRLNPRRESDFSAVERPRPLDSVEMFKDWPMVQAHAHSAFSRETGVMQRSVIQLRLDFQRNFCGFLR